MFLQRDHHLELSVFRFKTNRKITKKANRNHKKSYINLLHFLTRKHHSLEFYVWKLCCHSNDIQINKNKQYTIIGTNKVIFCCNKSKPDFVPKLLCLTFYTSARTLICLRVFTLIMVMCFFSVFAPGKCKNCLQPFSNLFIFFIDK